MSKLSNQAKDIKVTFDDVCYGLIYFTIKVDGKAYQTRFSDVFDPLIKFKKWLEAICIGVCQCSFWFDTEGDEIKFDFDQICWDREIFTVSYYYGDRPLLLTAIVDRKQLVKSFYRGLLDFYETSDLLRDNWEVEYLGERLVKITKMDYDTIVNVLANMSRRKLEETLYKADPQDFISCPSAPEDERFGFLVDYVLEEKAPENYPIINTPEKKRIPIDFNRMNLEERKELVIKYLSHKTMGQEGTKIVDFKSEIVEKFLSDS